MHALTLKHPWAYAIARLGKRLENRNWIPPHEYVGRTIALHGGKHPSAAHNPSTAWREVAEALASLKIRGLAPPELTVDDVIVEGIFAVARYGGAPHERSGHAITRDPWFEGVYGWLLDDLVVLPEPVPCRGSQGLWRLLPETEAAVRRQVAGATRLEESRG